MRRGSPLPVYSVASGLDYPGVRRNAAYPERTSNASNIPQPTRSVWMRCMTLAHAGIIPALESAHAVA